MSNNILSGVVTVSISGLNPEKFINMAVNQGILIWNIQRESMTTIIFNIKKADFNRLKNISKKTKCRVRIKQKYGLEFLIDKLKRRKSLIIGASIFIFIIVFLSSIIWSIDISGNNKVESYKIYEAVKDAGLKEGKFKKNIKLREVEKKVLNKFDEISVIKISYDGTMAKVEVVERDIPPLIYSNQEPTNIVASKDGIILDVYAYKGQKQVSKGDFVKKGQVLISGTVVDNENNILEQVHSMGMVNAKTWYENISKVPLNYKYEERTGKVKKKVYMMFFNKKLCIKNSNIDFKKYDKIEEKNVLNINSYKLPVYKISEYYFEKEEKYKILTEEEAFKIGTEKAEEELQKTLPANVKILDKKIERELNDDILNVRILYIVEENIGIEEKIF